MWNRGRTCEIISTAFCGDDQTISAMTVVRVAADAYVLIFSDIGGSTTELLMHP